jgi:type II secretory ATPase GspE/PulE/Tfp pilus assembly ATPase PilB-like protein
MVGNKIKQFLVNHGYSLEGKSDSALLDILAEVLELKRFNLVNFSISSIKNCINNQSLSHIPTDKWKKLNCLPINIDINSISIAITDPLVSELQKEINLLIPNYKISFLIAEENDLLKLYDLVQKDFSNLDLKLQLEDSNSIAKFTEQSENLNEANIRPEDVSAPLVIRLLDKIFSDSLEKKCSDIHLTPTANGLDVKIRVDGILQELLKVPAHFKHPVVSRIKLLSGMDIAEKRKPQDGRLRLKTNNSPVDLRISTVPGVHGETVVMRVLATRTGQVTLESLGMSDKHTQIINIALKNSSKVILVSGPTGSGKTSTLYGCLNNLADGSRNIITIEDPVEYRIEGITQVQINSKTDVSFAAGLRSALRQDPDVIMVGEIRDTETAQIAMQAAQTGHLVLSTIHTNSAESTITRLEDLGLQKFLIANSISTIIAQRLVRKTLPDGSYSGRLAVLSILELTDEICDLIRSGASETTIIKEAKKNGFQTLWEHGLELVSLGLTTEDELERVLGCRPKVNEINQSENSANNEFVENQSSKFLSKPTMLLVEDDDSTRAVMTMLFEEKMFNVIEACNGVDALEQIFKMQTPPSIIVTDLMMPKMSGIELLKKLKKDPRLQKTPVILLTAATSEENELNTLEHGADDFIPKASDSRILVARVERLLSK